MMVNSTKTKLSETTQTKIHKIVSGRITDQNLMRIITYSESG